MFAVCRALIGFVESRDSRDWYGYLLSVAMFAASMLYGTTFHASFKNGQKCGLRLRSALTIAVYKKVRSSAGRASGCGAGDPGSIPAQCARVCVCRYVCACVCLCVCVCVCFLLTSSARPENDSCRSTQLAFFPEVQTGSV